MSRLVVPISNSRQLRNVPAKPTKTGSKKLVDIVGYRWATVIVWLVVLSFTLKVFRSGGRGNLSFFGWIINHTVYGNPVEYVPEEIYASEFEGMTIDEMISRLQSLRESNDSS